MRHKTILQLLAVLMIVLTSGCNSKDKPNQPSFGGKYDMWLAIGEGTSSTQKQDPHVVKKIPTLLEGEYDIRHSGAETLASGITPFVIYHKGYYYSISRELNFGKYKITDKGVETIKQFPMVKLSDRRFAHEWLDDNTLVLIGAPDSKDKDKPKKHIMNWFKIDVHKMKVIGEGSLDLPKLADDEIFSSCGLLAYRKADNKLLFNFRHEEKEKPKMGLDKHKYFFTAVIDAKTMEVDHVNKEDRVDRPGSVSFGSLRQQNGFFMDNGDYYMLCNTVRPDATSSTQQFGAILRIKAGEYKPDPSYKIDLKEESKIIHMHHMEGNKVFVYLENPMVATGTNNWKKPLRFFWAVVDLATGEQYRIKEIPFSQGGTYTELIVTEKDYAILGISDNEQTKFFKYEYKTEKVTDAAKLKPGYFADRIVVLDK